MPKSAAVERSKTSYTPATETQDSGPKKPILPQVTQSMNPSVTRNNTQITPARPSPNATIGGQGQVRGLSIRRPGATPMNALPSVTPSKGADFKLDKELYINLISMTQRRWCRRFMIVTWIPMTRETPFRLLIGSVLGHEQILFLGVVHAAHPITHIPQAHMEEDR